MSDDYSYDLPDQAAVKSRILSVLTRFLTGELGVIATARLLSALQYDAEPHLRELLLPFVGIDSETDTLPVGEVRQYWRADALKIKDRKIAEAEQFYRQQAVEDATNLIRLIKGLQ